MSSLEGRANIHRWTQVKLEKGLAPAKAGRHRREASVEGTMAIWSGKLGRGGGWGWRRKAGVPQFTLQLKA